LTIGEISHVLSVPSLTIGEIYKHRVQELVEDDSDRRTVGNITEKLAQSRKNQNNLLKIEKYEFSSSLITNLLLDFSKKYGGSKMAIRDITKFINFNEI
jgi:hypothetical protein